MTDQFLPTQDEVPQRFHDSSIADRFEIVASIAEACAGDSERALLLMSTCRNQLLTVNAIFLDLRAVVAAPNVTSSLGRAIFNVANAHWEDARKALNQTGLYLSEIRLKFDVWHSRLALLDVIQAAIGALELRQADLAKRILGLEVDNQGPLFYRSTDFDLVTQEGHASDLLDLLLRISLRLQSVADALSAFLDIKEIELAGSTSDQLFDLDRDARAASLSSAVDRLRSVLSLSADIWHIQNDVGSGLTTSHGRMILAANEQTVPEESLETIRDMLSERAATVLGDARNDLIVEFRPNALTAPMPDPFIVDLTPPVFEEAADIEVEVITASEPPVQLDEFVVAALACGIPESWYTHDGVYHFLHDREAVLRDLTRDAVRRAHEENADVVVFPEAFLLAGALDEVHSLSAEKGIIVVGGRDMYTNTNGEVVNKAQISIPGLDRQSQSKQRPSVYEVRENEFWQDGLLKVFRNTRVGDVAVLLCSDYLEGDLLSALSERAHIDLLVVSSRNPNPQVFERLAIGDAARLYCNIVICNAKPDTAGAEPSSESGEGTIAATPRRANPIEPPSKRISLIPPSEWEGASAPELLLFSLSRKAIAARHHQRPQPGYLSAPHFTRRR